MVQKRPQKTVNCYLTCNWKRKSVYYNDYNYSYVLLIYVAVRAASGKEQIKIRKFFSMYLNPEAAKTERIQKTAERYD